MASCCSPLPLGYLAGGSLRSSHRSDFDSCMLIDTNREPLPPQTLERFWSLEDIGIKETCFQTDDETALKMFTDTVECSGGRYFVKWPWKSSSPELPDNYGLAYGRLSSLLRRIESNKVLMETYNRTIEDQLQKSIIEDAPKTPDGTVHYLPHHCVVNPSKNTTKVRIVYDASAKLHKTSLSLNECLYRGPVLLADAVGIILRWRMPRIAIVSEIEKAFLQIGLKSSEKDVTRFLWLKDIKKPLTASNLRTLRFCRVPFGVISSPFILAATVTHHLKNIGGPTASSIEDNIYVDNVFGAASSLNEAKNYYLEAKNIFSQASMNLREWFSNSEAFMDSIDPADRGDGASTSVLGLKWNLRADTFGISTGHVTAIPINWTKRRVLQHVASIFDPCGYVSPLTIRGKLIMQEIWKANLEWDDGLPQELATAWIKTLEEFVKIPSLLIPRQLDTPIQPDSQLQLHCFCDASAKAYSAAVYLRNQCGESVSSNLLFAKSRVAPIKSLSIPRLELIAVLIGTRLLKFVEVQLHLPIAAKNIWTDSTCVLHWILKDTVSTTFVKNRIKEIHSIENTAFQFVPTAENPADGLSRGTGFTVMRESRSWWHGPPWLAKDSSNWPVQPNIQSSAPRDKHKPEIQLSLLGHPTESLQHPLDASKYSSLHRLLRVTAYVLRFVGFLKTGRRSNNSAIAALELGSAKTYLEKSVQGQHFKFMFGAQATHESNHMCRQLSLFVDSDGLVRCRNRYYPHGIDNKTSYPKLLPRNNPFTDLIIKDCHTRLLHSGVKHTLAELRQEYWVTHSRNQVKRVIKGCNLCRIYQGSPFRTPRPPPLPSFRVTPTKPFDVVGIDYFGPLIIRTKNGSETSKVWVCLFTCATVRAIHLEVVDFLSTEQFLLCFRRFMSSYGRPRVIVSDNARQFHFAEKTIHRIWTKLLQSEDVQSLSAQSHITWKFITELAPWMGGFYERMVGLVKNSLKKSIHYRCLTLVELQTLLCEISSMLNTRPLLYSEESPDGNYLTPAHFLLKTTDFVPTISIDDEYRPVPISSDNLVLKWKRIQALLDSFWKSWSTSYLQSLQDFAWKPTNRNTSKTKPEVGTVVLIKDSPLRGSWKLGVIAELIQSQDNICRSVRIRLASGTTLRRPLKLIYPLESCKDPVGFSADIVKSNSNPPQRARRNAAMFARANIRHLLADGDKDDQ